MAPARPRRSNGNKPDSYATETRTLCEQQLAKRKLDAETHFRPRWAQPMKCSPKAWWRRAANRKPSGYCARRWRDTDDSRSLPGFRKIST